MSVRRLSYCIATLLSVTTCVVAQIKVPTGFVPNRGQWQEDVLYGARTQGGNVWIVRDGFIVDSRSRTTDGQLSSNIVAFRVNKSTGATAVNHGLPIGTFPIRFLSTRNFISTLDLVPRSSVVLEQVLPGISIAFNSSNDGSVTYTVHAESGATIPQPFFLTTAPAEARSRRDRRSESVERTYDVGSRFDTEDVGKERPIPIVAYAEAIRGSADEEITGSVVLSNGDVAVCGWTTSVSLVIPSGGATANRVAGDDGFVAIYSPDLQTIKAWTYIAGSANDRALGLCRSSADVINVICETTSNDLPVSVGSSGQVYSAGVDGYFCRFTPKLDAVLASRYIRGDRDEHPTAIGIDAAGAVYVCGSTSSARGFDLTNGYDVTFNGNTDAFLMKLTATAANIAYSTYYGGGGDDIFNSLAVDPNGQVTLAGATASQDFPTVPTVDPNWWTLQKDRPYDWTYNGGNRDAVAVRFRADGGGVAFATFFGGASDDVGRAVCVDARGQTYLVGETMSEDLPTAAAMQNQIAGMKDVFVAVLDEVGMNLTRSTYYGGEGVDNVRAAIFVGNEQIMIAGSTTSYRLATLGSGTMSDLRGGQDCFLATTTGSALLFGTLLGWNATESAFTLCRNADGDIYVGGRTMSEITIPFGGGASDAFLAKWIFGNVLLSQPHGGETFCLGKPIQLQWTASEMPPGQKYDIDLTTDGGASWMPIARNIGGTTYSWTPTDQTLQGRFGSFKISTSRGHRSLNEQTFAITVTPVILTGPTSVASCPGDSVALTVQVQGVDYNVQWRRNGTPIAGAKGLTLTLPAVQPSHAGQYDVVVTGPCSSTSTSTAAQIVVYPATRIMTKDKEISAVKGAPLQIGVTADGKDVTYAWYHDGLAIPAPRGTAQTLRIASTQHTDAGQYSCAISGACGTDSSLIATVTVEDPSAVAEETSPVHVNRERLILSPNPASSSVVIDVSSVDHPTSVQIISVLGQHILQMDPRRDGRSRILVDCSALPAGAYVVMVEGQQGPQFEQLILTR